MPRPLMLIMLAPNSSSASQSDELRILNSPRKLLFLTVAFFTVGMATLPLDLRITRFAQSTDLPGDFQRLIDFSEGFGHGLGVALIILTVGLVATSWKKPAVIAIYAFGAGLVADIAKVLVARHRPYHQVDFDGTLADTFIGWMPWLSGTPIEQATSSFPSAHSATAVGLALGLTRLFPKGKAAFVLLGVLGGIQRIDCYAHFASDVLIGASIAFGVAASLAFPRSIASRLIASECPTSESKEGPVDSQRRIANADNPVDPIAASNLR